MQPYLNYFGLIRIQKIRENLINYYFLKLFRGIFIHDYRIWLWIVCAPDVCVQFWSSRHRTASLSSAGMWLWEGFDYSPYGLEMEYKSLLGSMGNKLMQTCRALSELEIHYSNTQLIPLESSWLLNKLFALDM